MNKFFHSKGRKSDLFTRPLILLVYIPLFFILLMSSIALGGGRLNLGILFKGAWNYEVLAILTYLVAASWEKIRNKFSDSAEDTFGFVLKYLVSGAIGIILGIELIKAFGSEFVVTTLLLELPQNLPSRIPPILIPSAFILLVIAGFRSSLKEQDQKGKFEQMYHQTRFMALKGQLNPHFLFNALNLISSEIEENPTLATEILDEFAELLRGILNLSRLDKVALWQEFKLISHYLKIQEQRFSGRISTSIELSETSKNFMVPPLLIQPLVENAFIHGLERMGHSGHVQVFAREEESYLFLEIKDNGQGFDPSNVTENIGVSYVRDVLELLYGDKANLQIHSSPGEGTQCIIQIPKELV